MKNERMSRTFLYQSHDNSCNNRPKADSKKKRTQHIAIKPDWLIFEICI